MKIGYKNTMFVYSSMYAFVWVFAWLLMAERVRPGHKLIKKRWLPERMGGEFYSLASSVFIGIFGYLVRTSVFRSCILSLQLL